MQNRPALFRGRHFEDVIIILCVRWYLRYSLSYRDLEEMMVERGLSVDHVTIARIQSSASPEEKRRKADTCKATPRPNLSFSAPATATITPPTTQVPNSECHNPW